MAFAPLPDGAVSDRASSDHGDPATAALDMAAVSHRFGDITAVDNVDLSVRPGEILTLVGPSGCGKTTLLRLAAGLEDLQTGAVRLDGQEVGGPHRNVPPEQRAVGLMFQDFALFPHLTVGGNIAFGLEGAKTQRNEVVDRLLKQVRLSTYREAYPHTLSGGQQQRVALARALAPAPRVMLMDEPFSGLDSGLRATMREETLRLLREVGTATMVVTHDPQEALYLGDRVAVMSDGKIVQVAKPADVYYRPTSPFVATFFGDVNRLEGRVDGGVVATVLGPVPAQDLQDGAQVQVLIRPEAVHLEDAGSAERPVGTVVRARFEGRASLAELSVDGPGGTTQPIQVWLQGGLPPAAGSRFAVMADLSQAMVFIAPQTAA
ncbi:MAG: ABC transporter ATP-binding protein [Pseudomonadota bacterium]